MSTDTQIEEGDIVEIIRDLDYFDRGRKGTRFTVDYIDDALTPDDEGYGDPKYLQGPVANGWANHSTACVDVADLRLVTKAKDIDRPTPARVAAALRIDSMSDAPWFCHTESLEGDGVKVFEFEDEETGKQYWAEVHVVELVESEI